MGIPAKYLWIIEFVLFDYDYLFFEFGFNNIEQKPLQSYAGCLFIFYFFNEVLSNIFYTSWLSFLWPNIYGSIFISNK